jgi:RNA polymerase sigma-70 factor (sigma-E family)
VSDQRDEEYYSYVRSGLPALRRLAYVLSQDGHRADDLVQATLERLYRHWGRARKADNLAAYARAVLVRVFLGEKRTAWARRVVLVDTLPEQSAPAGADTASKLTLRAALATLPPKQRAVLVLRFYADLTVEETADALGFPANTVKSHAARGLAALRRTLADDVSTGTRS